jgi:hypothetical protein
MVFSDLAKATDSKGKTLAAGARRAVRCISIFPAARTKSARHRGQRPATL